MRAVFTAWFQGAMDTFSSDADFLKRARARLSLQAPPLADGRPAAVLMPLLERDGALHALFTLRAADLPSHAGQVSFPGGCMEAGEDALACALRETVEETGIARRFVEPLGFWPPCTTSTGYAVAPLLGRLKPGYRLTPDAREVAEVFSVPVAVLMDDARYRLVEGEWRGRWRRGWVLEHEGYRIWGATAAMLRALRGRLYGRK